MSFWWFCLVLEKLLFFYYLFNSFHIIRTTLYSTKEPFQPSAENQAPAVQTVDSDIQRIEIYPVDFEQLGLGVPFSKRGQGQNLCCENEFYLHENKNIFISMSSHLASL